jgi:hypothetical protein
MCIKLAEVNLLISFFRDYISPSNRAIKNIVDKIEFFDDENDILKEEPNHEDYKKYMKRESDTKGCVCACNCQAKRAPAERAEKQDGESDQSNEKRKIVKYFLFVKPPDVKEVKKPDMVKGEQDIQMKKHILELLKEAETLESLKITIMDQNSLSEIMSTIR